MTPCRLSWRRFCALLGALFVARGIFLLCFFPPLEGFDEYQHVAYLVYLHERGAAPEPGRAAVPVSLYPDLVAQPHSAYDYAQTRAIGTLRYKDFPGSVPAVASEAPIALYQAQHPPLYYRLLARPFAWLRDRHGFRAAVYAARLVNLLFAGAALALMLHPLRRLFRSPARARLAALAISLLPMLLVYVCRVGNDALALLFAGLATVALEGVADRRHVPGRCAAAGALAGAGVAVKLTVFALLPAALLWVALLAVARRLPVRVAVAGVAALAAGYLLVAGKGHLDSLAAFGTPFAAQETIRNAAAGRTGAEVLGQARWAHARTFLLERLVLRNLWTSGWSFLKPHPGWTALFGGFFGLAVLGLLAGPVRRWIDERSIFPVRAAGASSRDDDGSRPAVILLFALLVLFVFLAAYAHGLHALSAREGLVTPSYYVMPAFPFLLALALAGVEGFGSRTLWYAGASALGLLFLAAEAHSLFTVALPHWTGSRVFPEMLARAAAVHPAVPSPWAAPGFGVTAGALGIAALLAVRGGRATPSPGQRT